MNEFKHEDRTITQYPDQSIFISRDFAGHVALVIQDAVALEKFFQQKRDEELGIWRDPRFPEFAVYVNAEEGDAIRVLYEPKGGSNLYRRNDSRLKGVRPSQKNLVVARAYFDAHPLALPWQEPDVQIISWFARVDGYIARLAQRDPVNKRVWHADDGGGRRAVVTNDELAAEIGDRRVTILKRNDTTLEDYL